MLPGFVNVETGDTTLSFLLYYQVVLYRFLCQCVDYWKVHFLDIFLEVRTYGIRRIDSFVFSIVLSKQLIRPLVSLKHIFLIWRKFLDPAGILRSSLCYKMSSQQQPAPQEKQPPQYFKGIVKLVNDNTFCKCYYELSSLKLNIFL